jgi:uncharacterized membrane protein
MNIKLRAALDILMICFGVYGFWKALDYLGETYGSQTVATVCFVFSVSMLVILAFAIRVAQLKYQEKQKEQSELNN